MQSAPRTPDCNSAIRVDSDPLGPVSLPVNSLHGAQAERARDNFALSGITIASMPQVIVALAEIEKAAAITNQEIGTLPHNIAVPIIDTCDALIRGEHHDAFDMDVCQGGAGTSTNMMDNEVIANLALDQLGQPRGQYDVVHPNDQVNR